MLKKFDLRGKYEKDILNFLRIYANSSLLIHDLKINSYDFREAFIKACIGHLGSSENFLYFIKDFYFNNLKKRYFFYSKEEIDVARLFVESVEKKVNFFLKLRIRYLVVIFFYKFIIILINFLKFFTKTKKNNLNFKNVGFYINKNSELLRASKINMKEIFYLKKNSYIKFFLNYFNFDKKFFFLNGYYFSKSKYHVVYKVLISFFLIQQEIFLKKKKVIVSFEGDHYDHEIIYILTKVFKIKSVCIQSATDLNIFPKAGFHNIHQNKYLVWGPHYKKIFRKISPLSNPIVSGNYLINSKHKNLNTDKIGIFLKQKNDFLNKEEIIGFEKFINWLIINFKNKILIRPHPSDKNDDFNILRYKNEIIIENPNNVTVGETLSKCSFLIANNSSVIIEAISIGVIPIVYNKNIIFDKNISCLEKINYNLISSDIEILKKSLERLLSNQSYYKFINTKLRKKFKNYIYYNGVSSLKKIKKILSKEDKSSI
jgi:hypothetical protein